MLLKSRENKHGTPIEGNETVNPVGQWHLWEPKKSWTMNAKERESWGSSQVILSNCFAKVALMETKVLMANGHSNYRVAYNCPWFGFALWNIKVLWIHFLKLEIFCENYRSSGQNLFLIQGLFYTLYIFVTLYIVWQWQPWIP